MFWQKNNSLISVSVSILGPSCPNHEVKGSTKTIWGPVVNVKKLFFGGNQENRDFLLS